MRIEARVSVLHCRIQAGWDRTLVNRIAVECARADTSQHRIQTCLVTVAPVFVQPVSDPAIWCNFVEIITGFIFIGAFE
jgi:hypothetical protein